jgi:hypothetical protein
MNTWSDTKLSRSDGNKRPGDEKSRIRFRSLMYDSSLTDVEIRRIHESEVGEIRRISQRSSPVSNEFIYAAVTVINI